MSARRVDSRRGIATLVVLLAIGIATVTLVGLQGSALRQAAAGREAVARVRAEWAARAALESMIAALGDVVERGEAVSTLGLYDRMDRMATGRLLGAEFTIRHTLDGVEREGVEDAHAKINVNRMTLDDLMELPGMSEDMAAAILDWVDEDDLVRDLGAEKGYYGQLASPYEPRNGSIRTLLELELVAGVEAADVRGEDWNLNSRLDPNEDDGDATWPPDDADGELDAGWSAIITAGSVDEGLAVSGEPRLDLVAADEGQLMSRVDAIEPLQARVILDYARREGTRVEDLIATPLQAIAQSVPGLGAQPEAVPNLNGEQLQGLLDETTVIDPDGPPPPGRLNLNAADRETLEYLTAIQPGLADQLIFARDSRPDGFESLLDLLEVVPLGALPGLSRYIDVRSVSFVVSARGRDVGTGIEVDLVATIERTSLPIVISELRVR